LRNFNPEEMNEKCVKSVDNGACLSSLMLADHLDSCCECCRELLNAEGIEISDEATKMFKILLGFDVSWLLLYKAQANEVFF